MTETDYGSVIQECAKQINVLFKGKGWTDDEKVTRIFDIYYKAIWSQIHNVLVPQKTDKAEKQVRDILAKYVIGCTKNKVSYMGAIQPIKAKLAQISKSKKTSNEFIARYLELYDDFMALASFRSFKHYCFYMQSVFEIKLWTDNERAFSGYWFYANKMVLDGDVKFLEKQLPTGTGKSLSDCFMHSWIFGVDINSDIFKVCGNDKFTDDCFQNVIKLMTSSKYAKVFPYYAQFDCNADKMYQFNSRKELKFSITGCTVSTSLRIATKLSETSGVRAKYLFIDDICQSDDLQAQMVKDINKFKKEWFRRNYNLQNFYIIASGTSYSQFDILAYLKREMGFAKAIKSNVNEFTWVSTSNYITKDGVSVFVKVPALDDKDESVFPTIRDTFTCRKLRESDYAVFMAMEQQEPLPPDSSPFYFTKLRQYTTLPLVGECGRLETCIGALDTKRRGKDYLSMPIFFEANDPDRKGETAFFLVDWLYDDRPMKECIPLIVSKIIQHKITRLYVERNTEECIETLLSDKLREQGYTSCVIEEVYSTEPKDRRIMSAEGDIKSRLIFPQYGMYAQSSDVGRALLNVYGYTYTGTVAHDDAPDSLALFVKRFVMDIYKRKKAKLLYL